MLGMKLLNLNDVFSKSELQLHINDIVNGPGKDLKENLYNVLPNGGEIESYPSCRCGHTRYEDMLGEICPRCNTPVMHDAEQNLESRFYIAKPVGINKFLNPKIYMDLVEICSINKDTFNPIFFLTISNYKPTKEHKAYKAMLAWEIDRSWNYFVANIRTLIPKVLDLIIETTSRKFDHEMKAMLDLINYDDELIYSDVIPVINKLILAIEQTGDIKRKSPTTEKYGLAITDLISLPTKHGPGTNTVKHIRKVNDVCGKAYRGLNDFYDETIKREGKKGGLCRSDTLGLRSPFTWRAVIVQICVPHRGDELHMPYTACTYLYEPQILQILTDELAMTANEALNFLAERRRVFSNDLHKIMTRIIYSYTDEGSPTYHVRYPTLYSQSGQLQYITVIKKDPEDKTVGVPAAALPGWNGDFDGDELTGCIIQDMAIYNGLKIAHLSKALLDINNTYEFGGAAKMPDPIAQMWCSAVAIHTNN
ncbi:hypothetical protein TSMG0136 [Halocynthia phage JM-2012]|uniref:RNA polymerase beta subunit n=1 Tax=Halocynthia phage JM-2012 TaxID=1173297 RepID=UPI00025C6964|nr:RNA polymerase beta subunit [Halocynthia phage JM-2012]AFI55419.1 hypothetical protein TSMG0136 [Halocynthia phage JM-2012]